MLLISLLMISLTWSPRTKRKPLTTPTTLVHPLVTLLMMSPTGLDQKVTSAPLMLPMPPPNVPRMLKVNGASLSMMSTTTPRLPVLKPACSQRLHAVLLLHATRATAPRSMSTTVSSPSTHVTHTRVSSSTSTSSHQLVHATSQLKLMKY